MDETLKPTVGAKRLALSCGAVVAALTYWIAFHNYLNNGIAFCVFCVTIIGAALVLREQSNREKAYWTLGCGAFVAAAVLIALEPAVLQSSNGVGPWLWWLIGGGSMLVLAFDERRASKP